MSVPHAYDIVSPRNYSNGNDGMAAPPREKSPPLRNENRKASNKKHQGPPGYSEHEKRSKKGQSSTSTALYSQKHDHSPRHGDARRGSAKSPQHDSRSRQQEEMIPSSKTPRPEPADRKNYGIPSECCLLRWNPDQEPFKVLNSIMDGDSLGRWIHDWALAIFGAQTAQLDIAGLLWNQLIKLTGIAEKKKVAEFIERGRGLMENLRRLLKEFEEPFLGLAKDKIMEPFMESLLGKEQDGERVQGFSQSVRQWALDFDANYEDIVEDAEERGWRQEDIEEIRRREDEADRRRRRQRK
ncbi:Uu.00g075090.m01.CDS01 [Anthostomella pinea]|uniref:Uu.00g075090.m01.CDS01 n=1 Tax=Anthostomella pinea TaxID=933095 RepID=A0AAI8YNZ8_9PEZI|nr:Uu.00g075090.m01.CDS01 [Anthostomella pinea]